MTQFDKLVEYANKGLQTAGLTLSKFGLAEMRKRFKQKESEGGYSEYWKSLEACNKKLKVDVVTLTKEKEALLELGIGQILTEYANQYHTLRNELHYYADLIQTEVGIQNYHFDQDVLVDPAGSLKDVVKILKSTREVLSAKVSLLPALD